MLVCLKGARRISWNVRGPRGLQVPRARRGQQARQARRVPKGRQAQRARQVGREVVKGQQVRWPGRSGRPARSKRPDVGIRRRRCRCDARWLDRDLERVFDNARIAGRRHGRRYVPLHVHRCACDVLRGGEGGGALGRRRDGALYPRVSISKDGTQVTAPQPRTYCEYADGVGATGFATLTKQPKSATPTYQAVSLDIGGTADCLAASGPGGVVASIALPEGFYNVTTSVTFQTGAASSPPRDG